MKGKRINRCEICKEPLKHVHNNQWMCQQSLSKCEKSTKIIFIKVDEEEWMRVKLKKYVRYTLTLGAFAHLIEFASAIYETAYITAGISIFFGILDALAVYVLKDEWANGLLYYFILPCFI